MRKKLTNILLIDDLESDLFLTSRTIKKAEVTEFIKTAQGGKEALDYLSNLGDENYHKPDIIFLDINMPGMSGWEFLDEYNLLSEKLKARIVVCMLTTSRSQADKDKAAEYGIVNEFTSKPLTKEVLMSIIEAHFPECV